MPLEPLTISKSGASSISLDRQYRLRLSATAMRDMKLSAYQFVVISVDVDNKRLGVAKQDLAKVPNATALKIDKRSYIGTAAGKMVARKLAIAEADLPKRFDYIGQIDDNGVYWAGFELAK